MTYKELKCLRYLRKKFSFKLDYNRNAQVKVKSLNFDGSISYHYDSLSNALNLLDNGSVLNYPMNIRDYIRKEVKKVINKEQINVAKRMANNKLYNPFSDMYALLNKLNYHVINEILDSKIRDLHKLYGNHYDESKEMISLPLSSLKGQIRAKLIIN